MKRALALVGLLACLAGAAKAGPTADAEAALDKDDYVKAFALYTQAVAEAGKDPGARASALFDRAEETVADLVEALMGRKPELRFRFIQENAEFAAEDIDV